MILNQLPLWMAICLGVTIIIEATSAYIIGYRDKKSIVNIILANVITNPLVVVSVYLIGLFYGSRVREIYEYSLEAAVVFAEGLLYLKTLKKGRINPFLLSVILNALSYGAGLIINIFI